MEFKDYYEIMGVAKDATEDEVKRAYRKLARKFHPDVSKEPDAESKFKEVGEAYEVLKDPEKRAAYDQLGRDWKAGQEFRPPPNWDAGFEFSDTADDLSASDFFEALFGNRGVHGFRNAHTGRPSRSQDHHAKVVIDLEDVFHGATRTITLHSPEIDAQGHVKARERTLRVKIPKGIKRGQQIRLAGQGNGTGAGDLYLEVEFRPHPIYRVEGNDLHLNLPVAPWEVALGAKVKVPTPAGVIDLTIPSGSKAGSQLRLKGRGIPGDSAGDMYAHLQLVLPPVDSEQAKALYRQMEQQLAFNPRAALGV